MNNNCDTYDIQCPYKLNNIPCYATPQQCEDVRNIHELEQEEKTHGLESVVEERIDS